MARRAHRARRARAGLGLAASLAAWAAGAAEPAADPAGAASLARATFAGGCFWCMEQPFDEIPGVVSTTAGYTGGQVAAPSYEQVSAGTTGHAEAVQVVFDPARVRYEELLAVFWRNIDPTAADRQFCDRGSQYRSAIFTHDEAQAEAARRSKAEIERSQRFAGPVVTEIAPAGAFYPAEEDHQDYYAKNPVRYGLYRAACGRDRRLRELWGEGAGHRSP
jgi:peptide-methionine (S)-S-oxide reductase